MYRVGQKADHFQKLATPVYDDTERHAILLDVQLFIWSKTGVLRVTMFKYSLHKLLRKILHKNNSSPFTLRVCLAVHSHRSLSIENLPQSSLDRLNRQCGQLCNKNCIIKAWMLIICIFSISIK